ncbi:CTD kinase subunit gamma CTK3-domain-containing protein [Umbelopsis sp. PMI_123]|nr:CTD kinase subunit gamma CTK3-domain-containing protein [Umbelopsis sp. PMI_123]
MSDDYDPFECRLEFTSLLQKLNASQQSIQKVANYAMRNKRLSEDLYSCVLESLEQASMNARLNILYVLDSLCQASLKSGFKGYVDLVRQDLDKVIAAVVPNDASGMMNAASTRKILNTWKHKGIFDKASLEIIESRLPKSEVRIPDHAKQTFSKNDILKRMEEDRERHKRLREDIWIRSAEESEDAQFDQLWESTEPLELEFDYKEMSKENYRRWPNYPWNSVFDDVELTAGVPWYDPVWQRPLVKSLDPEPQIAHYEPNTLYAMQLAQGQTHGNNSVPTLLEDTESIDEEMEMAMSSPEADPTSTIIEQRTMTYSTTSNTRTLDLETEDHPSKRTKYDSQPANVELAN